MKITRITVRNFKGRTGSLDLLSANFLIGSNWTGKTTWLDAVAVGILGFCPKENFGKTPGDTFRFASGRDMEIAVDFDDGSRIRRRWFLKGDSVRSEKELPPELVEALWRQMIGRFIQYEEEKLRRHSGE